MSKEKQLNYDYLKKILNYDPETGHFLWAIKKSGRVSIGSRAGTVNSKGRRVINIDGRLYFEHRLAIYYLSGVWPTDQVDHINRNPTDNRIVNLREVSGSKNARNRSLTSRNTSGFNGVSWSKASRKWIAGIGVSSKYITLGSFDKREEAIHARKLANKKYGYDKSHGLDPILN